MKKNCDTNGLDTGLALAQSYKYSLTIATNTVSSGWVGGTPSPPKFIESNVLNQQNLNSEIVAAWLIEP